ncbi:MAG: HlyD family efflux transporter periplasmic adaptor subunit, partial [Magnetococcales bacterium]|nr:HlyD family efflux transporter periplasmic adaptor subunit [Magnetococcales bacterium]
NPELLKHSLVNDKEMEVELVQYRELRRQQARMTVTAPADGWISLLNPAVKPGVWLTGTEALLDLTHPERWHLIAYVRETDLPQVQPGNAARFLPESMDWAPIECRIIALAPIGATLLEEPSLVAQHGGNVPVRRDEKGRWLPTTAVYRVELQPTAPFPPPAHILRGTVVMENHLPRSLFSHIHRGAMEILIRETGF